MKSLYHFCRMLYIGATLAFSKPPGEPIKLTRRQRFGNFIFLVICAAIVGGTVVVGGALVKGCR